MSPELAEFVQNLWRRCRSDEQGRRNNNRDQLFTALTSKKWRSSTLGAESAIDLNRKLDSAIKSQHLEFSLPFGGYKSHHIESYPFPNWSEVFAVSYLRKYLENVRLNWSNQITLSFSYCSSVMDLVNRTNLEDQDLYISEFQKLLAKLSGDNIEFRLHDVADSYGGQNQIREALHESYLRVKAEWGKTPSDVIAKRISSAVRNVHLEDVGKGNLPASNDYRVEHAAMMCEALDSLEERRKFNKYSTRIQLVNVRGPALSIHLRSCETSANHFGVGYGVASLEKHRWRQRIMTSKQWLTNLEEIEFEPVPVRLANGFSWLAELPTLRGVGAGQN